MRFSGWPPSSSSSSIFSPSLRVGLARRRTGAARSACARAGPRAPARRARGASSCVIDSRATVAELVVGLLAARDADQVEALGQRALVGEVVERGQQLAVARSPVAPKIDQRRRRRPGAARAPRPAGCRRPARAGRRWGWRPARSEACLGGSLDRVPAELVAQRGQHRACSRPPCASRSARTARRRSPASGRRGRSPSTIVQRPSPESST